LERVTELKKVKKKMEESMYLNQDMMVLLRERIGEKGFGTFDSASE
jgi:hypothetical protein